MSAPLYDISLIYWGTLDEDTEGLRQLRNNSDFICDFYHKMLFGYKPPRTGRICIHLNVKGSISDGNWGIPDYNGAICRVAKEFNEQQYFYLEGADRHKYLLDIIHESCIDCSNEFGWDRQIFEEAYAQVLKRQFVFYLSYSEKKSPNRKTSAYVEISKTVDQSELYVTFLQEDQIITKRKLIQKINRYCYDSIYELASHSKWLDPSCFGVRDKKNRKYIYYSITDDVIISSNNFKETDI